MVRAAILAGVAAAMLTGAGRAAAAAGACGPLQDVTAALIDEYGETPVWAGSNGRGQVMLLFLGTGGGTWTVVTASAADGGEACAVLAGSAWQPVGGGMEAVR